MPPGPAARRRLIIEAESLDVGWEAAELVLFESITGGGPARYQPLLVVPLSGRGDRDPG